MSSTSFTFFKYSFDVFCANILSISCSAHANHSRSSIIYITLLGSSDMQYKSSGLGAFVLFNSFHFCYSVIYLKLRIWSRSRDRPELSISDNNFQHVAASQKQYCFLLFYIKRDGGYAIRREYVTRIEVQLSSIRRKWYRHRNTKQIFCRDQKRNLMSESWSDCTFQRPCIL